MHDRKRKLNNFFSAQGDEDTSIDVIMRKFIKMCLFVFNDLEKITINDAYAEFFSSIERLGNSENQTKKLLFINKLPIIFQKLRITDEKVRILLEESIPDIYLDVLENYSSDTSDGSREFEEELIKFSQEILDTYHESKKLMPSRST